MKSLFIEELGWNHYYFDKNIIIDEKIYKLAAVAEKRGFVSILFRGDHEVDLPNYTIRRRIEKEIAKSIHEHIIIYTDAVQSIQVWQWVKREPGKPSACREHRYYRGQSGEALIQKLEPLVVTLEEEDREDLTIVEIASRVRAGFDVDRVTKRFYERFKNEHEVFRKFINGIANIDDLNWYASLMLNRLMFIYFIQKKGFLDKDREYLRNRLKKLCKDKGKRKFYSFYRYFLKRLFHEGLGQPKEKRNAELEHLLGTIPFLNGGLFDVHQLEKDYKEIDIPDKAFERLFDFFDAYQWHLDERPLRADNEINPDVLGYIFEKYINQKQMGAYYTKEDITEYTSRNTVIPYLFDAAKKDCRVAFEDEPSVWHLLKSDPERYIFPAVGHGIIWDVKQIPPKRLENAYDLPNYIGIGLNTSKPNLFERRKRWNETPPETHALPTEKWRETVARRQRYHKVHEKLSKGELNDISDLITCNLNIRQFAQDVIESSEGPELLRAFWKALSNVKILDPTCGSGAFLFATLNILEPLYQAALDRMQLFVEELEHSKEKHSPKKYMDFRHILKELHEHPNERYFILKKIILNNLYGVDIMDEAVEICKLRLFLKLVAQVEPNYSKINLGLEPLPDIDFNIRAGNTLVGFTSLADVKKTIEGKLDFDNALERIEEKAKAVDRLFKLFRQQQTELGGSVTLNDKEALRERLCELEGDLNQYLAYEYRVDYKQKKRYNCWLESHKPFHWFIDFYSIMKKGGFDVVIGNPPYVNLKKISYSFKKNGVQAGDLYGYIILKSISLLHKTGNFGFIVMHSLAFSKYFQDVRKKLKIEKAHSWFSFYARIPSGLFSGDVRVRNCIFILRKHSDNDIDNLYHTTRIHRWFVKDREYIFPLLDYIKFHFKNVIPMFDNTNEANLFENLNGVQISTKFIPRSNFEIHFKQTAYNWIAVSPTPAPCFDAEGKKIPQSKVGKIYLTDEKSRISTALFLNGKLFFCFWLVYGDEFDVTKEVLGSFILPYSMLSEEDYKELNNIYYQFNKKLPDTTQYKLNAGKKVGTYNTSKLWHLTDRSDMIFLKYLCDNPEEMFENIQYHLDQTIMTEDVDPNDS